MSLDVDRIRAALPVLQRVAYLNTGTFGPLPRATAEAMAATERMELEEGRSGPQYFPHLRELRDRARAGLAAAVNADPASVALTRATTDGCNIVVAGLRLGPEDEVVTTDLEHYGLLGALGVSPARVRVVRLLDRPAADALDAIRAEVGPRTRLIAVSHVAWSTGQVLPIAELASLGVPVLVDGAQGAGAVPVDVQALGCDFYTISGQKWLLGPDATGGLYVRPDWHERLAVAAPSYYGQLGYEDDGTATPAPGALRFDAGTMAAPSLAGLVASLEFGAAAGEERFARAAGLADVLRERLLAAGHEVVTEAGQATLVSWRPPTPAAELVPRLAERGVIVRDLPRLGWLRASVGFWTSEGELDRLVEAL
ncbi:MAG: aminotransferase class V-fold PLP-dependent enzyme [Thermoleophilia bacterium]